MTQQPFHHGNLRAVLLDRAEQTLRETGVEDLSLRELARQAGVSHGAPRSHFIDRQALLDAVAERGFMRLADDVAAAGAAHPQDLTSRLRAVASAYVDFAVTDAGLMDLMFSTKSANPPVAVQVASERLFSSFGALFDADFEAGRFNSRDQNRTELLFVSTLQGIAALVATRRIPKQLGDALIDDAIALFLADSPA